MVRLAGQKMHECPCLMCISAVVHPPLATAFAASISQIPYLRLILPFASRYKNLTIRRFAIISCRQGRK
jgi:hypothetical protein